MRGAVESAMWAVLAFVIGGVFGCEKQEGTQQPSHPKYTIGMSQCNLGEPWRVQMNADIRAAAKRHPEIKMVFKDAQNDALRQLFE